MHVKLYEKITPNGAFIPVSHENGRIASIQPDVLFRASR